MPRVKRGTVRRAKRKKLLGLAKGYYANKSKLYRAAKESVDTALKYAFVGRRRKKRDFRRLWVVRINAAAREHGLTYGQLISGLKQAGVTLDRKSLSELAIASPAAFGKLAAQAKAAAKPVAKAAAKAAARSHLQRALSRSREVTKDTKSQSLRVLRALRVFVIYCPADDAPRRRRRCHRDRPVRSRARPGRLERVTRRRSAIGFSAARTASSRRGCRRLAAPRPTRSGRSAGWRTN